MKKIKNFFKKLYNNYQSSLIPIEIKDEIQKLGERSIKVISKKQIDKWELTFTEYYWETFWKDLWIIQTEHYIFKYVHVYGPAISKFKNAPLTGVFLEEKKKIV